MQTAANHAQLSRAMRDGNGEWNGEGMMTEQDRATADAVWATIRDDLVRDWLGREGSYGGGYVEMSQDEPIAVDRIAAAIAAARAEGRAAGLEEAARVSENASVDGAAWARLEGIAAEIRSRK